MSRNQSLEVFKNMVMPYEPTTFDQNGDGSDQSAGTDSTQTTGADEQPSADGFDKASE